MNKNINEKYIRISKLHKQKNKVILMVSRCDEEPMLPIFLMACLNFASHKYGIKFSFTNLFVLDDSSAASDVNNTSWLSTFL
jgi:hypothetical protein